MKKGLYLLQRPDRVGYDEYDAAVVCATSGEEARFIHPSGNPWNGEPDDTYESWTPASEVIVTYLGDAEEEISLGLILASFNAG